MYRPSLDSPHQVINYSINSLCMHGQVLPIYDGLFEVSWIFIDLFATIAFNQGNYICELS